MGAPSPPINRLYPSLLLCFIFPLVSPQSRRSKCALSSSAPAPVPVPAVFVLRPSSFAPSSLLLLLHFGLALCPGLGLSSSVVSSSAPSLPAILHPSSSSSSLCLIIFPSSRPQSSLAERPSQSALALSIFALLVLFFSSCLPGVYLESVRPVGQGVESRLRASSSGLLVTPARCN